MLKIKLTTLDEVALVLILLLLLFKAFGPKLWLELTKHRGKTASDKLKESSPGKKKNEVRDIPGPWPSLPVLGTRWIYGKPFGPYRLDKIHTAYEDMFKRYGPILREESLWNYPIVSIMEKNAVEMVLRGSGGKYPLRPPTEATAYYRRSRPDRYSTVGLVNEQGPAWHHLRATLTPELTSTKTIARFLPEINAIADDFVQLLKRSRDESQLVTSFEEIANCIGLESTCTLILGRRMGFLEKASNIADKNQNRACSNNFNVHDMVSTEQKKCVESLLGEGKMENDQNKTQDECKDRALKLASAVKALFQASRDTYYGLPFWKIVPTPAYRRMAQAEEDIYDIISELVDSAQEREEAKSRQNYSRIPTESDTEDDSDKAVQSVFMSVLQARGLPLREKKAAIIDFIAAGIQTLGNTLVFLLYLISKDKKVQDRLFNEVDDLISHGSTNEITNDILKEAVYLKACIMESFRVLPTAPLVARILDCQMNLSGYNIPAGTVVLCHTWMACLQEKNFISAKEFRPERWLRDEGGEVNAPFLVAPFGCGRRMCPGKRFVEQELQVLLAKIIHEFYIEFPEGLRLQFEFLLSPGEPVNIKFHDRKTSRTANRECQR
ncbi:ecdysone 20-monooxygenase-like [Ischnura elegans]|uniref:ecdysone 20-monooxygenase-like n=1 Tax=Ischnura elegans TaxID=197161 RepID=UPI001ED8B625|nr:ecdysone 20-monooxygenase-like [Ischnura elegans]XP_046403942.1 ecdysone 20-monooxygenase-like [Ischnura elegans]XP_046403948.1 ecdysone 20-monooxygenase-like [Ischnura elegans]